MQINKFFKKIFFISREYKFFAFLIAMSICCAYGLFILISYQNHKNTYNQKYLSLSFSVANSYEVFLDNIFRQAEFIGNKISHNRSEYAINNLLKHSFSLNSNLDTSLLSSWVKFKWIDKNNFINNDRYNLRRSKSEPWLVHFDSLHSTGSEVVDSYIPVSFGITKNNGAFIGTLSSNINISSLLKFLQHSIQDKQLSIVILDRENNVIGQTTSGDDLTLPKDFFKNQKFTGSSGNIYTKFDLTKTIYISYKKLDSYPFTIIVGDNSSAIFRPLFNTLIKYFLVLVLVLFALLAVLLLFYKKIITPITSLSSFAKGIISSDEKINYTPEKHSFVEISNLEQALIKIENYKKELSDSNKELNLKTDQLELIKKDLEKDLEKLSNSYNLRDNLLKKSLENTENVAVKKTLEQCLSMLFPEIYSRQLKIVESIEDVPDLKIKYCNFVKIVTDLLSRSFIFSSKNTQITVKTEITSLNGVKHLGLMIEDTGIGDEEWRKKSLNESCNIEETREVIEQNNGVFKCVDRPDSGVKYCVLFPYNSDKKVKKEVSNIIHLFPNN